MTHAAFYAALKERALSWPECHEEHPWGEVSIKVRKKVFLFLGGPDPKLSFSMKLPESAAEALAYEAASPTGYGLGKHGWVSFGFEGDVDVPLELALEWLEESFRAVAPKTVVKKMLAGEPEPEAPAVSLSGHVLVVSDGPMRGKRALQAVEAAGAAGLLVSVSEAVDTAGEGPDAILVDAGRSPAELKTILADLVLVADGGRVVLAGIRSKADERAFSDLAAEAVCTRAHPGSVDALGLLEG